jgi:CTP:molybdopterin cytidylyltransferase MocA
MNNMVFELKDVPVIILAAGESERIGIPKGLLDYKGTPFLTQQLMLLFDIGFSKLIIVLGKDAEQYKTEIQLLNHLTVSINPEPDYGPFSSLQCGLETLNHNEKNDVFILPVDVPCPEKEVWNSLLQGLKSSEITVTIPEYKDRRGHPVLLSNEFVNHLLLCNVDSRLDHEINKQKELNKAKIISVKDKRITLNINTLEDWEAFKVMK